MLGKKGLCSLALEALRVDSGAEGTARLGNVRMGCKRSQSSVGGQCPGDLMTEEEEEEDKREEFLLDSLVVS